MSNIHTNIRVLREEARLSQEEFAERLEVNVEQVKMWEKGKLDPTESQITKMCPILRIHEEDFLERDILQERNEAGALMKKGSARNNYNWYYGNRLTMSFFISYLIVIPLVMILAYVVVNNFLNQTIDTNIYTPEELQIVKTGIKSASIISMLIVEGFVSAVYAVCYFFKKGILKFQLWYILWITPLVSFSTVIGIFAMPFFYGYAIYKGIIKKGKNH